MRDASILIDDATAAFAADVHYSLMLQPRQLPTRYLYDSLGSALFEAICRLPWYHVTRAELALLETYAREICDRSGPLARIVELGCGSGEKLATLLESSRNPPHSLEVHLIDVSPAALMQSERKLSRFDGLQVVAHRASYEEGLADLAASPVGATLVLFLGSNIGNFDRPSAEEFLRHIRASMAGGDLFLVGADLVKPERDLLLAYDDPLGVSSAFNLNLLCRLNRELGADFDLGRFAHRAVWNRDESRMEMYLVSQGRQHVRVPAADVDIALEDGEPIWTESSYKFQADDVVCRLEQAGFAVMRQWVDAERGFALTLARATPSVYADA